MLAEVYREWTLLSGGPWGHACRVSWEGKHRSVRAYEVSRGLLRRWTLLSGGLWGRISSGLLRGWTLSSGGLWDHISSSLPRRWTPFSRVPWGHVSRGLLRRWTLLSRGPWVHINRFSDPASSGPLKALFHLKRLRFWKISLFFLLEIALGMLGNYIFKVVLSNYLQASGVASVQVPWPVQLWLQVVWYLVFILESELTRWMLASTPHDCSQQCRHTMPGSLSRNRSDVQFLCYHIVSGERQLISTLE